MPNRNLVVRFALVTSFCLVPLVYTGCSNFAPTNFKRMLSDMTDVGGRKRFDSGKYYFQPDSPAALEEPPASVNTDDADTDELESTVAIVLPEESQEVAIQDFGSGIDGIILAMSRYDWRAKKLTSVVPSREIISHPLAPLQFDHRERKKLGNDELASLRTEKPILLTANPAQDLQPAKAEPDEDRVQPLEPIVASDLIDPRLTPQEEITAESTAPLNFETQSEIATTVEPAEVPPLAAEPEALSPMMPPFAEVPELCALAETDYPPLDMSTSNLPVIESPGVRLDDGHFIIDGIPIAISQTDSIDSDPPAMEGMDGFSCEAAECDSENDFAVPACHELNDFVAADDVEFGEFEITNSEPATDVVIEVSVDSELPSRADNPSTVESNPIAQVSHSSSVEPDAAEPQPPLEDEQKQVEQIQDPSELRLANVSFCTSVSGYGQFTPFPRNAFQPRQRLLVYCEIENFTSVKSTTQTEVSFRTRLRGSYLIQDDQGQTVDQKEFPVVEDVAETQRRDFYVHLPIRLGELAPRFVSLTSCH